MINATTAQQPEEQATSLPMVCCGVCEAGYVPAPAHKDLKYAPVTVLEAALMGMSHFCFRCRRAACPACWDEVHGICGSCVEEAHLSFRKQVGQLEGVMLPSLRQIHTLEEQTVLPMLVCVQPGRFQDAGYLDRQNPSVRGEENSSAASENKEKAARPPLSFLRIIERLMTIVLASMLVAILLVIVLAEVSAPANMVIVQVLHIDIRQEIAYLLHMMQLQ